MSVLRCLSNTSPAHLDGLGIAAQHGQEGVGVYVLAHVVGLDAGIHVLAACARGMHARALASTRAMDKGHQHDATVHDVVPR